MSLDPKTANSLNYLLSIAQICQNRPQDLTLSQCKTLVTHIPFFLLAVKFIFHSFRAWQKTPEFAAAVPLLQKGVDLWASENLKLYIDFLTLILQKQHPYSVPLWGFPERFHALAHRLAHVFSVPM